jgi:protein TonB
VSNTLVAIEKKPWLRPERAASLLRLVVVVAVHGAVIAALLSWTWPSAPIEVSILSLEDLGGDVPTAPEVSAAERLTPDVDTAAPATEILPTAVAPVLEPAQTQQIDIALSQGVPPPALERQVVPEVAPEQVPEEQVQPTQTPDSAPAAPIAPNAPPASPPTAPTTSAPTPASIKAPAAVRSTPDLDASARPGSAAKVTSPSDVAKATAKPTSTSKMGLTGNASGSSQVGTDIEPALTAARFDADYLHNPAPAYPSQSRRLKEEGTVLLLVRVSAQGTPLSVEVRNSSGFERLDEAGLQAVRQWRFVPAKRGNENVAASVLVPIQFKRQ